MLSLKYFYVEKVLPNARFMCLMHSEAKHIETLEFGAEKGLSQGHAKRWVACASKAPNSCKGFSKAFLKAKRGEEDMISCCKLLGVGILCSFSCPHRSGHHVPINLQQNECYSLFCNFLSLYEWTLKGQSPENRLSYIF